MGFSFLKKVSSLNSVRSPVDGELPQGGSVVPPTWPSCFHRGTLAQEEDCAHQWSPARHVDLMNALLGRSLHQVQYLIKATGGRENLFKFVLEKRLVDAFVFLPLAGSRGSSNLQIGLRHLPSLVLHVVMLVE